MIGLLKSANEFFLPLSKMAWRKRMPALDCGWARSSICVQKFAPLFPFLRNKSLETPKRFPSLALVLITQRHSFDLLIDIVLQGLLRPLFIYTTCWRELLMIQVLYLRAKTSNYRLFLSTATDDCVMKTDPHTSIGGVQWHNQYSLAFFKRNFSSLLFLRPMMVAVGNQMLQFPVCYNDQEESIGIVNGKRHNLFRLVCRLWKKHDNRLSCKRKSPQHSRVGGSISQFCSCQMPATYIFRTTDCIFWLNTYFCRFRMAEGGEDYLSDDDSDVSLLDSDPGEVSGDGRELFVY